jgi:hypothetical protein
MLIVAAAVLALLACVVAVPAVALLLGIEPRWLPRARHALGEARHRAGGVLAEFGDWLRLGR